MSFKIYSKAGALIGEKIFVFREKNLVVTTVVIDDVTESAWHKNPLISKTTKASTNHLYQAVIIFLLCFLRFITTTTG